jgi:hypothetical protein
MDLCRTFLRSGAGTDAQRASSAVIIMHAPFFRDFVPDEAQEMAELVASSESLLSDRMHDVWISAEVAFAQYEGDTDRGWDWFHKNRPTGPHDWGFRALVESSLLIQTGRYLEAKEALVRWVGVDDELVRVQILIALGYVNVALNDLERASEQLAQAEQLALASSVPLAMEIRVNTAWLAIESGRPESALQLVSETIEAGTTHRPTALSELAIIAGMALVQMGQRDNSRQAASIARALSEQRRDLDPFTRKHLQDLLDNTGPHAKPDGRQPRAAELQRLLRSAGENR